MAVRVAIADDEMLVAMVLQHLMTSLGYEVVGMAGTGREAVDLCHTERPDLVLMDVRMPEMNGLEATRKLIETCPTCVVVVTGNPSLEEAAAESGAMGYVVKPAREDISSVIRTAQKRFSCFQQIRNLTGDTEEALEIWRLAWSAMKALMRQGMSEAEATGELKRRAAAGAGSMRAAALSVLASGSGEEAAI